MRREAVFAKQGWYPYDADEAREALADFLKKPESDSNIATDAVAVVSPHAGWAYSGGVAGELFAGLNVPDRVIVLCPMHRSGGERIAVWPEGSWETPLGDMPVDEEFTREIIREFPAAAEDYEGHMSEHAVEIQLPFIKARNKDAKIIPIRLGRLGYKEIIAFGQILAKLIEKDSCKTLIVASSDMSHEGNLEIVAQNDEAATEQLLAMDLLGFLDVVEEKRISMCGYIPAAVAMSAAAELGAVKALKVAYTNSAEISGRTDYVVGYLGLRFDA